MLVLERSDGRSRAFCLVFKLGERSTVNFTALLKDYLATKMSDFAASFGVVFSVIAHGSTLSLHLQDLDGLGQHQLTVQTLGCKEANLAITCI